MAWDINWSNNMKMTQLLIKIKNIFILFIKKNYILTENISILW